MCVVLPPGAAHRSSTRSPATRRESPRHQHRAPGLGHDRALLPELGALGVEPASSDQALRQSGRGMRAAPAGRPPPPPAMPTQRVDANRRLGGVVDRLAAARARAVGPELASTTARPATPAPSAGSPRRAGSASSSSARIAAALRGGPPEDRVDEPAPPRTRALGELDGLVDRGVVGDAAEEQQLVEPEPEGREHRRVEPLEGAAGEALAPRGRAWRGAGRLRRRAPSRTPGRVGPARAASAASARSAYAPCSNTLRTTVVRARPGRGDGAAPSRGRGGSSAAAQVILAAASAACPAAARRRARASRRRRRARAAARRRTIVPGGISPAPRPRRPDPRLPTPSGVPSGSST